MRSESHVLKLVHAGGFVELHSNPILASEVMKKNPRHCVTRPDIFKFPWIVVSPESVLTPGNVFFIVPCHTIRCLLKSTNPNTPKQHLDRFLRNESSVDQDCHRASKISNANKIQCFKKQSSVSTSTSCLKFRTPRQRNGGNRAQSFARERPVYSSEYTNSLDSGKIRARNPNRSGLHHSEQIPKLKSCLKKKDKNHNGRSRDLKAVAPYM
ncbi:hypothetical protein SESBI_18605 [Sesbania bispinosa]|nr:hypothetical protein SESBI_18605 [Sesbania bispinosa]